MKTDRWERGNVPWVFICKQEGGGVSSEREIGTE